MKEVDTDPRRRAPRSVDSLQKLHGDSPTAFQQFADKVRQLHAFAAEQWRVQDVEHLAALGDATMREKQAQAGASSDPHHTALAHTQVRAQLQAMLQTLQPPAHIVAQSAPFRELLQRTGLATQADEAVLTRDGLSSFENDSLIAPSVRDELRLGYLVGDVRQVIRALDRKAHGLGEGDREVDASGAPITLNATARRLRAKRKKNVAPEEAEAVAEKALAVLRELREEIAWVPARHVWLKAAEDEVFATALAAVPKELFEETQAFSGIQDLRRGDGVFADRALERVGEAVARTPAKR